MKIKALVMGVFSGSFKNDSGQDVPYHQLQVIDTEAASKEVINLKLSSDKVEAVMGTTNKMANIDAYMMRGKLVFNSFA